MPVDPTLRTGMDKYASIPGERHSREPALPVSFHKAMQSAPYNCELRFIPDVITAYQKNSSGGGFEALGVGGSGLMTVAPVDATTISVSDTLQKLENDFGAMAAALESGEFALWVGSGISRRAPSLGTLVTRAVEFLRQRAADAATSARFRPALATALKLAGIEFADVEPHLGAPFPDWPNYVQIRNVLWNKYSDLLDVRFAGEPSDANDQEARQDRAASLLSNNQRELKSSASSSLTRSA